MSAEIMSLFGPLSNPHIDQRISAASSIVSHLIPPPSIDAPLGLDPEDPDFQYTLKRLIRGLASPTVGARLGFAVALTEIMSKSSNLTSQSVYALLLSSTTTQAGMRASEERDMLLGRLFGIKAIITSGLIFKNVTTTSSASVSSFAHPQLELWNSLVDELINLSLKRPWLAPSAGWVLVSGMLQTLLNRDQESSQRSKTSSEVDPVPWKSTALKYLIDKCFVKNQSWTLEKLAMAILLQRYSVSVDWQSILLDKFTQPVILSQENYEELYNLLIAPSAPEPSSASNLASSRPGSAVELSNQPHFIHSIIASSSSSSANKFSFAKLYSRIFENYYFTQHESNPTRKSQGFTLLNGLLASSDISPMDKASLLTPATVYTLMVQLAARDRLLHKIAQSLITTLLDQAGRSDSAPSTLAHAFACEIRKTLPDFDQRSKTKTVENLLALMTAEEVQSWVHELIKALELGDPDQPQLASGEGSHSLLASDPVDEKFRERVLSQLCAISRNRSIPKTNVCTQAIIHAIITCGFFGQLSNLWLTGKTSVPKSPMSKKSSTTDTSGSSLPATTAFFDLCRSRFYTCISDLSCQPAKIAQSDKSQGISGTKSSSDSRDPKLKQRWTSVAIEIMQSHLRAGHRTLVDVKKQDDPKQIAELDRLRQVGLKLRNRLDTMACEEASSEKKESLALLCESIILMSYDDHDDLVGALGLLERIATHSQDLLQADGMDKGSGMNAGRNGPSSIDVLIETLVYLLSWPIAFVRNVVEQVFTNFADRVSVSSLQILIDQMIPSNSLEDETGSVDGEEDAGDLPEGVKHDLEAAGSSDGESSDDEDDGESISGNSLGSIDSAFRDEVAAALGNAWAQETSDAEADSDGSSDVMGDAEMLALDANLAALFQRRSGKAMARAQNTQDLHLRLKLADLFAKFVKSRPDPLLLARLITPMLNLIRKPTPGEEDLRNKILKILQDVLRHAKTKRTVERDDEKNHLSGEEWMTIFEKVYKTAKRAESLEISNLCNQSTIWLLELAQHHMPALDLSDAKITVSAKLLELYRLSLTEFCIKKNAKLQPKFFSEWVIKAPLLAWNLKEHLLDLAQDPTTVNSYRKIQVLSFLQGLTASYVSQSPTKAESEISKLMPRLKTTLFEILKEGISLDEKKKMNTTRVKELLNLLCSFIEISRGFTWPVEELMELSKVEGRKDLSASKVVEGLFKKALNALRGENGIGKGGLEKIRKGIRKQVREDEEDQATKDRSQKRSKRA